MVHWCEEDGYTVLEYEVIDTPEDEDFMSITILKVSKAAEAGICAGLRSDAAGRPADLQAISVRAGLSRAGMNTSLVRHGLLVAGLTIPSPARLAIGISLRATAASNGPIIAVTVESATKPSPLEATRLGYGKPPRASSTVERTTS